MADDRCSPSILIMPSPCDPHAEIALDRVAIRTVEIGRVIGHREQAHILRQCRHDAGSDLERGRPDDAGSTTLLTVSGGGIEAVPEIDLQIGPPRGRAVLERALQPCADPSGSNPTCCQMICARGSSEILSVSQNG